MRKKSLRKQLFKSGLTYNKTLQTKTKRVLFYLFLLVLTVLVTLNIAKIEVRANTPNQEVAKAASSVSTEKSLVAQGREFYQLSQYQQAVEIWQTAAVNFAEQGELHQQAMTLNLLSLAYQQLGEWEAGTEAVAKSLKILEAQPSDTLLAQALNAKGHLQFLQGQIESALTTWEEATKIYEEVENQEGKLGSLLNQTQALQALGLYTRELKLLNQIRESVEKSNNLSLQINTLQAVGKALKGLGELQDSEEVLQESLTLAQELQSPSAIAANYIALGNTARTAQNLDSALAFYQQAEEVAPNSFSQLQAQLNSLSLLLEQRRYSSAKEVGKDLQAKIWQLPPSQKTIYAQINFAESMIALKQVTASNESGWEDITNILENARQQAVNMGDRRAQAYAVGRLGEVYEIQEEWGQAQELTEQALNQAQVMNADDISYRWQWQLGRILNAQGDRDGAIASYTEAVNTLQALRTDLVSINTDVQFSFRQSVEPIYRQLISLLLEPRVITASKENSAQEMTQTSQGNIQEALVVLEKLQLAELDNFFGDACLDMAADFRNVSIGNLDPSAGIIYPIILQDRLELILSLPGKPLQHYGVVVPKGRVEATVARLRQALVTPRFSNTFIEESILPLSQDLYEWLIQPLEKELANQKDLKTLVFVLDGSMRNIPMGVLHDGDKYLLQKYAIAINPGQKLPVSQPLANLDLKALTGGLSLARQGFSALPGVQRELEQIQTELPTTLFLNESFTSEKISQELESVDFPIIHLATHGVFSSTAEETFIITWDGKINVNELENLLKARSRRRSAPIELLVFSACETAQGDERAALGIAGVAVRAGARSTLATLWAVSDDATSELMTNFYKELTQKSVSKVEALRKAQLGLLSQEQYQHPLFWAAYTLVGNWL